jgi:uncharacterized protein (TIGR00730 family)
MNNQLRITVFGGSIPKPGESAYLDAYRLGVLIGEAGFTVLTGGYIGTMEAVSRGAAESGGRVIGVTCDQIETWRSIPPNEWVQEEIRFPTLNERLYALIEECDAAFVLPGGIGTLAEVAVMWSQMQTRAILPRRLIMIGPDWRSLIEDFKDLFTDYIPSSDRKLLEFAPDVETAFQMLIA